MNADSVRRKARKRAIRGAKMLDKKMPGWHKFPGIDIDTLDMSSNWRCVIGQLFPKDGYIWGIEKLSGLNGYYSCDEFDKFVKRHGFDASAKAYGSEFREMYFDVLQRVWTDEILNRRAADFVASRLSED